MKALEQVPYQRYQPHSLKLGEGASMHCRLPFPAGRVDDQKRPPSKSLSRPAAPRLDAVPTTAGWVEGRRGQGREWGEGGRQWAGLQV